MKNQQNERKLLKVLRAGNHAYTTSAPRRVTTKNHKTKRTERLKQLTMHADVGVPNDCVAQDNLRKRDGTREAQMCFLACFDTGIWCLWFLLALEPI